MKPNLSCLKKLKCQWWKCSWSWSWRWKCCDGSESIKTNFNWNITLF